MNTIYSAIYFRYVIFIILCFVYREAEASANFRKIFRTHTHTHTHRTLFTHTHFEEWQFSFSVISKPNKNEVAFNVKRKINMTFNFSTRDEYTHSIRLCYVRFLAMMASDKWRYSKSLFLLHSGWLARLFIRMNTGTYVNTYRMLTPYL